MSTAAPEDIPQEPVDEQPLYIPEKSIARLEELPVKIADHIVSAICDILPDPRQRKEAFRNLRYVRSFYSLVSLNKALYAEMRIFTTEASLHRLRCISNHDFLKTLVEKISVHMWSLSFNEKVWPHYLYRMLSHLQDPQGQAAYAQFIIPVVLHGNTDLQDWWESRTGYYAQGWRNAFQRLTNLRTIELTANNDPARLVSPTVNRFPLGSHPLESILDQQLMRRLYIGIPPQEYMWREPVGPGRQTWGGADMSNRMLEIVMHATSFNAVRLEGLVLHPSFGISQDFDFSPYGSSLGRLRIANLGVAEYESQEDEWSRAVQSLCRQALHLTVLRILGEEYARKPVWHTPWSVDAHIMAPLQFFESNNVKVDLARLARFIMNKQSLQYILIRGDFDYREQDPGLNRFLIALKGLPNLANFDLFLMESNWIYSTHTSGCNFSNCHGDTGKLCRLCRDTAKIKADVLMKENWPRKPDDLLHDELTGAVMNPHAPWILTGADAEFGEMLPIQQVYQEDWGEEITTIVWRMLNRTYGQDESETN